MSDNTHMSSTPPGIGRCAATHWSVVLAAGRNSSVRHELALSTLCQRYRFPLVVYLKRHGHIARQAADYSQAFFAQMLEKYCLGKVEPKSGKSRSFLLAVIRHFVADEYDPRQRRSQGM